MAKQVLMCDDRNNDDFTVMLRLHTSDTPCLVLWVANAELLAPFVAPSPGEF